MALISRPCMILSMATTAVVSMRPIHRLRDEINAYNERRRLFSPDWSDVGKKALGYGKKVLRYATKHHFEQGHKYTIALGDLGTFRRSKDDKFKKIRKVYGITEDIMDIIQKYDWKGAGEGGGKSGSVFAQSEPICIDNQCEEGESCTSPEHAQKFCLKSLQRGDKDGIAKLLKNRSWIQHMKSMGGQEGSDSEPSHFLIPIFGYYKQAKGHWYILMPYIDLPAPASDEKCIDAKFDFKGSFHGRSLLEKGNRHLKTEQWSELVEKEPKPIFKDEDFFGIFKSIKIEDEDKFNNLKNRINNSVRFLKKKNMIDYSLIIRIELGHSAIPENQGHYVRSFHAKCDLHAGSILEDKFFSDIKITIHFMTILDYLIPKGFKKLMEGMWKKNGYFTEASVVGANRYAKRMMAAFDVAFSGYAVIDPKDKGKDYDYKKYIEMPKDHKKSLPHLDSYETTNFNWRRKPKYCQTIVNQRHPCGRQWLMVMLDREDPKQNWKKITE